MVPLTACYFSTRLGGVAVGGYSTSLDFYGSNAGNVPVYARMMLGINTGAVGNESGYLTFSTINSGTLSEALRITAGGNVGIGTMSPNFKLHVTGTNDAGPQSIDGLEISGRLYGRDLGGISMAVLLTEKRVQTIQREATTQNISEIAEFLQKHLGQKITACLCGLTDPKEVGQWIAERSKPRQMTELRLREAYKAARMIIELYDPETARAWFFGTNTRLGDAAPAYILRHAESLDALQKRSIVPVARAFASGTD